MSGLRWWHVWSQSERCTYQSGFKVETTESQVRNRRASESRPSRARRNIRIGAAALTLAVTCAACGSGSSGGAASAQSSGPPSGTIRFAWWGSQSRADLIYKVISQFEAKYPDVKVQPEPQGNFPKYWTQLSVEAAAKNVPCVLMQATTYLGGYESSNVLMPLDSFIKDKQIDISGIPSSIINGGRPNGADSGPVYMIGSNASSTTTVWNTTMAQTAGIPPLTDAMSWTDYQNWLIDAQKKLPAGVKATDAQSEWNSMDMLYAWVRGHGQEVYKKTSDGYQLGFTEQSVVDYIDWWQTLIKANVTTTPAEAAEEPSTTGDDYLAQGKVLSEVASGNLLADQTTLDDSHGGTLAAAYFPKGPSGTNGNAFDVSGPSIGANCTSTPAAAAFVNFWLNDPQAVATFASNLGAVTNPTLLAPQLASTTNKPATTASLTFANKMLKANAPVAVHAPGYATLITELQTQVQNVQFGKISSQDAAKAFLTAANDTLKQQGQ
jgi:multiple sugar transport system substrate-binding protein